MFYKITGLCFSKDVMKDQERLRNGRRLKKSRDRITRCDVSSWTGDPGPGEKCYRMWGITGKTGMWNRGLDNRMFQSHIS